MRPAHSTTVPHPGAAEKVFQWIERKPAHAPGERVLRDVQGDLRLTAVDFTYPTRPDAKVLNDFSLHAHPGKVPSASVLLFGDPCCEAFGRPHRRTVAGGGT